MIAVFALSTLLAGCGPDPQTATKIKDLEERLAKMEAGGGGAKAMQPGKPGAEPVDQEMEQAAGAILKDANAAFEAGKYDDAREALKKLNAEYGSSRAARAGKRIEEELSIIGKDAGTIEVEKWFQGNTNYAQGKATLLVFWEVWCPHCKREVPKMEATWGKYKDKGLSMVGVTKMTRNVTEDQVKEFITENNVTYPMAKEEGQKMSDRFGVKGIPAAAVVKDGKVVWRGHPARINDEMIDNWIK